MLRINALLLLECFYQLKLLCYFLVNKLSLLNLPHYDRRAWNKIANVIITDALLPAIVYAEWHPSYCSSGKTGSKSLFFHKISTCALFFPFCFEDTLHRHCYDIDPKKRLDCGFYGIRKEECMINRGCCYDDTIQGVPWCFRRKTDLGNK